jgi:hypothetical protein
MSIQLSQDERDYLEQLANRKPKPTRRQKAIALLRLAEGKTLEGAAQDAGIKKEDVAALASQFSEQGLAGVGLDGTSTIRVRLVRPGVGAQKYDLPKGATLADLLRRSQATAMNQAIDIDGVSAEGTLPLRHGAVVMIVPQPRKVPVAEPWRATIPSFQDDALFEEYRKILKAHRHDLGPDESAGVEE